MEDEHDCGRVMVEHAAAVTGQVSNRNWLQILMQLLNDAFESIRVMGAAGFQLLAFAAMDSSRIQLV